MPRARRPPASGRTEEAVDVAVDVAVDLPSTPKGAAQRASEGGGAAFWPKAHARGRARGSPLFARGCVELNGLSQNGYGININI